MCCNCYAERENEMGTKVTLEKEEMFVVENFVAGCVAVGLE